MNPAPPVTRTRGGRDGDAVTRQPHAEAQAGAARPPTPPHVFRERREAANPGGFLSLAWAPTGGSTLAILPLTALTKPDEGRPITHREEDGLDARIAVDLVVERPQSLGLGVAHSRIRDRPTPEGVVHQK